VKDFTQEQIKVQISSAKPHFTEWLQVIQNLYNFEHERK
jgi:hypothetical protein